MRRIYFIRENRLNSLCPFIVFITDDVIAWLGLWSLADDDGQVQMFVIGDDDGELVNWVIKRGMLIFVSQTPRTPSQTINYSRNRNIIENNRLRLYTNKTTHNAIISIRYDNECEYQ